MSMKHFEDTFKAKDGLDLFYQGWLPSDSPKSVLAVVHGYDDHSGRYGNLVDHFLPLGYALYAFDHRGHGRSQGQRGHVGSFEDYLSDVGIFLNIVRSKNHDSTIFLVGHSMGGLIALMFSIQYPKDLTGVIVSSPFLGLNKKLHSWEMISVRLLSLIWPTFSLPNKSIKPEYLSHDKSVIEAKGKDSFNHHVTTPGWFMEITKAQTTLLNNTHTFNPPLLIMYGEDDKIVDSRLPLVFYEKVVNYDKKIVGYKGYCHEIFNEVGKEVVFKEMEGWLSKRV